MLEVILCGLSGDCGGAVMQRRQSYAVARISHDYSASQANRPPQLLGRRASDWILNDISTLSTDVPSKTHHPTLLVCRRIAGAYVPETSLSSPGPHVLHRRTEYK